MLRFTLWSAIPRIMRIRSSKENMGGRYHQKYKNCNRFKQNRIISLIVYRIVHSISKWSNQNTNSSVFFIRIKQAKPKQLRPIINEIETYVNEDRATVLQSSDIAISPAFTRKRFRQNQIETALSAWTARCNVEWFSPTSNGAVMHGTD